MIRDDMIVFYDVDKAYAIVDCVHISTYSRYTNELGVTHTYCLELVLEEEAYHVGLQTIYLEMSIISIDGKNFEFQLHNCNLYLRFIEHVLLTQPYLSTKMVEIFFQAGMHSEMPYKVLLA